VKRQAARHCWQSATYRPAKRPNDLNANRDSRDQGPPGGGSRQMDQQSGWEGKQDKNR